MESRELKANDVVQLSPECDMFAGCFMTITEPKSWGAQGFVQVPGGGQAYFRAAWDHMEYIGQAAFGVKESIDEQATDL